MQKNNGFTLLEMMITITILGILAAIAIPAYGNYVIKSHVRSSMSDLVSLSLVLENLYQRNLQYPASTADQDVQSYITAKNAIAWTPAEGSNFTYTLTVTSTAYTVKAVGVNGTQNSGCTITLTNTNVRTVSGGTACGGLTSW